jgi:hypothetical protein
VGLMPPASMPPPGAHQLWAVPPFLPQAAPPRAPSEASSFLSSLPPALRVGPADSASPPTTVPDGGADDDDGIVGGTIRQPGVALGGIFVEIAGSHASAGPAGPSGLRGATEAEATASRPPAPSGVGGDGSSSHTSGVTSVDHPGEKVAEAAVTSGVGAPREALVTQVEVLASTPMFEGLERQLTHTIRVTLGATAGAAAAAAAAATASGEPLAAGGSEPERGEASDEQSVAAPSVVYTIRRRFREVKALHAALLSQHGQQSLPSLPSNEGRFLMRPSEETLAKRGSALEAYLRQLCSTPELSQAGSLERFLDTTGRLRRPQPPDVPMSLFYETQALLTRRLPVRTRVELGRRSARATSTAFALELRMHRRSVSGPTVLMLVAAASSAAAADAWLFELLSLTREGAAISSHHLCFSTTRIAAEELRSICGSGQAAAGTGPAPAPATLARQVSGVI